MPFNNTEANENKLHKIKKTNTLSEDEFLNLLKEHTIPHYIIDNHRWSYIKPTMVNLLDKPFFPLVKTLFQSPRLMSRFLEEIKADDKVLMIGYPFGNLLEKIVKKIGPQGSLDIIDVLPYQLEKAQAKLADYPNVDMWLQDASMPLHREYNVIGLYFLLGEVPDGYKSQILKSCLDVTDEYNTKIVIIDYNQPHFLNPLRYLYALRNTFFRPYTNSLWENDLEDFIRRHKNYQWQKKYLLGKIFQKVVITPKIFKNTEEFYNT